MTKFFIALAIVISTAVGVYLFKFSSPEDEQADNELREAIEALRDDLHAKDGDVAALSLELNALRGRVQSGNPASPPVLPSKDEQGREEEEQFETMDEYLAHQRAKQIAQSRRIAERIEGRMLEERGVSNWPKEAEDKIFSGFELYGIEGSDVDDVTCGENVCRVEIVHHQPGNVEHVVESTLNDPLIETSSAFIPEPEEGLNTERTIVYYSRVGSPTLF